MSPGDKDPRDQEIAALKAGIRQIAHDLSNPLGILRMAVYFLQTSKADNEKRVQYLVMMNETIDKVEKHLDRLRALSDKSGAGAPQAPGKGKTV